MFFLAGTHKCRLSLSCLSIVAVKLNDSSLPLWVLGLFFFSFMVSFPDDKVSVSRACRKLLQEYEGNATHT